MKKRTTAMISQAFGIGDILFIQKMILRYASLGFRVVVPIEDRLSWMRYYLVPREGVEYPLLSKRKGEWLGTFQNADAFLKLSHAAATDKTTELYKKPIYFKGDTEEDSFVFLPIASSYELLSGKMMPAKYDYVGMEFSDWPRYVDLKRRPLVEQELYYEVLGLKDDSRYTLVNENSSRSKITLPVSGNVVHLREIDGFSLFDWSMVIEKAAQIVTIDTSLVILTEVLKQKKPLYMISRYDPPSFEEVKDILTLDWTLVPTAEELKVAAVI